MPGEETRGGEAPPGPDERLTTAEAAAPESAAAVAPRPPRRPGASRRARAALAALGAGLVLAIAVGLAGRCRSGAPPAAHAPGDPAGGRSPAR